MSSRQTFTTEVILNALEKTDNHPTAATNCNVDESGNFQKTTQDDFIETNLFTN